MADVSGDSALPDQAEQVLDRRTHTAASHRVRGYFAAPLPQHSGLRYVLELQGRKGDRWALPMTRAMKRA